MIIFSIRAVSVAFVIVFSSLFSNAFATSWSEAINLSEPALRDVTGGGGAATTGKQLVIGTDIVHSLGEEDHDIITLFEVRDRYGITQYLGWQSFVLEVGGRAHVAVSWIPERAGTYELRTFAFTNDWENPQVLSGVKTSTVNIASPSRLCSGVAECFVGTVTNIVDGDTMDVEDIRVRLALTNTPEVNEAGYEAAKDFTSSLCPIGSSVLVDQDDIQLVDVYGRMLAKVTCEDGEVLNAELALNAHAEILTEYCVDSEFSGEKWARDYGCAEEPNEQALSPVPDTGDDESMNEEDCDPSYPTVCIPSPPPDLDCGEISYRNFEVRQPDPHRFDGDKDGIGCKS